MEFKAWKARASYVLVGIIIYILLCIWEIKLQCRFGK